MVKRIGITWLATAMLIPTLSVASTEGTGYTADSLRKKMEQSQAAQESAANRMKASQADPSTLKLLTDREITFKLPNGSYVEGILLQSGKVAPALRTQAGLQPACVTSDYRLVPGVWQNDRQTIACKLTQAETIAVIDNVAHQVAQVEPAPASAQSPVEAATPTRSQGEADKYGPRERSAPQTREADPAPQKQTRSSNARNHQTAGSGVGRYEGGSAEESSSNLYTPPRRNGSRAKVASGTLSSANSKFGITMGTWMRVSLSRNVSSAESGQIEFALEESVMGRYRELPAGTVFFANKGFNSANKRLESVTVTALLPEGEEIQVQAHVYDLDQTAGLSGSIERDRESEIFSLSSKVALSTLSSITPQTEGAAGAAVSDMADGLINTEEKNVQRPPSAVIKVAPQRCLIKVVKTF